MRATAFVLLMVSGSYLLGSPNARADDFAVESADRVAQLVEKDASLASAQAIRELSALDKDQQLGVCAVLLARVSRFLTDEMSALKPLDLPALTWPKPPSDPATTIDIPEAQAAASDYGKVASSKTSSAAAHSRSILQMVLECADRHLSSPDASRDWAVIANDARKLQRELSDIENSLAVRKEVIPMIAEANMALLKAAALPDDDSGQLARNKRDHFISSAKTAVASCLPFMNWATERIHTDYRHAIESLVALEAGPPSKAMDLLINLSPGLRPPDAESSPAGADTPNTAVALPHLSLDNKRLLLLNRLTHDPANVRHLREFSESVLDDTESPSQDALDAARTVLSNAIYRVEELHIPEVLARLEQLEIASLALQQTDSDSNADITKAIDIHAAIDEASTRLNSLQEDLSAFVDGRGVLADGIAQLSALLDDTSATPEEKSRTNALLTAFIEAEQARNTLHYLGASTTRLEDIKAASWPEANLDEAVSILNASEQLLSSLWGLSKNATSGAVTRRCKELPPLLADYREQILYAKSKEGLAAIADRANQCETLRAGLPYGGSINDTLKKLEALVREAEGVFVRLPSPQAQSESQPQLQKMQASVAELRREQLNRYQHHVIAKCKEVLDRFDDQWYCTEGEALRYFENNNLAEVDQSLLTPEVSRCFNDCIGKLFSKMKPRNLVKCEEAMGRPEGKLKLESF